MKVWFVLLCFARAALAQATPTVKQAPPPGIEVPPAEARTLRMSLSRLEDQIRTLRQTLTLEDREKLLPDVEIFAKAVRYALEYHEFFKPVEFRLAQEQVALGLRRAADLKKGQADWISAHGPVVRAYRSRIDDSVQPYGLRVPEEWMAGDKTPRPLYLWFHGRNDTLSEVAFIAEQMKGRREFAPSNAFELHLYGRYCNASKFAGEIDAFEAMDAVKRSYSIDTNRIAEMGFSMGGATAWHMAAHFPGEWAVASAGAGFAETAIYAKVFDDAKEQPPIWEQVLWRWYDATAYAVNFSGVRMIAYSGEIDPQKQSADIMEKALAAEGLKLERLIGPNTAHKYEPEAKKELSRRVNEAVKQGRDPLPTHMQFATYTLRYNRMGWITLDRLEKHWTKAEITADRDRDSVTVSTTNVNAFTLDLPTPPAQIVLDGQTLHEPGRHFSKESGRWRTIANPTAPGLHKVAGLTGPIDDAFLDSFIFVSPTGTAWHENVGNWSTNELARAIVEWRRVFRGDARVKNDSDITDDDLAQHHLILWGDPGSNRLLARILPKLPLGWTPQEIKLGSFSAPGTDSVPILIFPNPLNPARYVVLNSGFTFRQGSTTSNSLQTPKLPDWAIIDLRTPPSLKWPGLVSKAGFFDDDWRVQ